MRRRSFSSEAKGSSEAIDGLGPGGGDSEREGEGMWLSPGGWVFPLLLAGVGFHVLDLSRRRMGQAEVEGVSWAGTINGRCCCVFPIVIPANNSISRPPPPEAGPQSAVALSPFFITQCHSDMQLFVGTKQKANPVSIQKVTQPPRSVRSSGTPNPPTME